MDQKTEQMLDKKLAIQHDLQNDPCDRFDYLAAVGCGAIAALVDIFLVGSPKDSLLQGWTDDQVDKAVRAFAKKCGWSPREGKESNTASAIGFLEKKFKVNYDQRYTTDVNNLFKMGTKNHHLKSLAHSPDILGLFCSVLNQFTSTATFISGGKLITIETETFELQGYDPVSKIFCGIANWFGHIMSDIAGSSGAADRGSGVAIPFFELFQLCEFGEFQVGKDRNTLAMVATKAFQEGYDARFGMTMAIPVVICDLSIRLVWAIKRHFYHHEPLNNCIPNKTHTSLRVMLIIGTGTLSIIDGIHAGVTSGGNAVVFFTHLNLIAWYKLLTLILKEILIRYDFTYEDLKLQFQRTNEALDSYLLRLRSVDYAMYEAELVELRGIRRIITNPNTDVSSLYAFLEPRTAMQFHNFEELDINMQDPDFVLDI